jgi:hypothetical protein
MDRAATAGIRDYRFAIEWRQVEPADGRMAPAGAYGPTFGLVAAGRVSFVRTPRPSLAWLGGQHR